MNGEKVMATIDLKAYTTRAKELESAIYTQKRLMESHRIFFDSQRPIEPKKKQINEPIKPFNPGEPDLHFNNILTIVSGIALVIGIIMHIVNDGDSFLSAVFTIVGGATFIGGIYEYFKLSSQHESSKQTYEKQMQEYDIKLSEYKRELSRINKSYPVEYEEYKEKVSIHDSKVADIMLQHTDMLKCLEKSINIVYEENVIFPKYRNLVAITAINEYLMSGRCDKLEGPDGAYNLYEMELRQNIIIAQLSSIIDNLEQIRNNQYSLYEELQKSNYTINEILAETQRMKESSKLTAYFSGVTALAEASPKYYHGIVI